MIANLVKAYEIRIKQLDWMSSDVTKQSIGKTKGIPSKNCLSRPLEEL